METREVLKATLKEQLVCLGKIFAKYQVEDEMIWEVTQCFDLIYAKQQQNLKNARKGKIIRNTLKKEPHPALIHLLEKLD